ncbi:MAG: phosphatase PAP2 family protein [Actinomycetota bacterium]|nr:phosphatase PAP2 family protein [Actinomycetota bacterium]
MPGAVIASLERRSLSVEAELARRLQLSSRAERALPVTQAVSHFGDHAAGWLLIGMVGAATSRSRRRHWGSATAAVVAAHGAAAVLKRIVRRRRPARLPLVLSVSTPSAHSFPSSHASSSAAAATAFAGLVPPTVRYPLAVSVAWSRLALGVHHPGDVAAGAVLGVVTSRLVRRVLDEGRQA